MGAGGPRVVTTSISRLAAYTSRNGIFPPRGVCAAVVSRKGVLMKITHVCVLAVAAGLFAAVLGVAQDAAPTSPVDQVSYLIGRQIGDSLSGEELANEVNLDVLCSALREAYRDFLGKGSPDVRFVHLKGSKELIRRRMEARRGHYMPPALIDSQFATLEEPGAEAIVVDIEPAPEEIAGEILRRIG